jgi:hypothetical protein
VPGASLAQKTQVKRIAAESKTLPATQESRRRLFLEKAFGKSFTLVLGAAELRVDDFGNVLPGSISPVRFSDFKESLEEFSALPGGSDR